MFPPPIPCPNRPSTESTSRPRGSGEEWSSAGRREAMPNLAEPCHSRRHPTNRHGNREGKRLDRAAVSQSRGIEWRSLYNMHAMTAAHRTLRAGTIVRVTNLQTGHTAAGAGLPTEVRSSRGGGLIYRWRRRTKVDVYLPGVAEVRVESDGNPSAARDGGKWAVQIGSFCA